MTTHEENQYLELIRNILHRGSLERGRNGNTLSIFGNMMRFSLRDGIMPLLTTKHVAWKTCFRELMWFVRGETDNHILKTQKVHIWDANGCREFLDGRGLEDYPEDVLGPIYGWQWRRFNAPYNTLGGIHTVECETAGRQTGYDDGVILPKMDGVDQLAEIIAALKDPSQRSSRRLIMTAWNPCQLHQMALPPCHILCQFNVREGRYLSCALYQRSGDVGLGVPFNIASYSFLTHILAAHCGLEADEFVYFLGNAHIYEQHVEPLKTQLERAPHEFPKIRISPKEHIEDYVEGDVEWTTQYIHFPPIKMEMVA